MGRWTARVEWSAGDRSGAIVVAVEAGTLRQAAWDALKVAEKASGGIATGIEVLTAEEYERRTSLGEPASPAHAS